MIKRVINFLAAILNELVKIAKWPLNPKNGTEYVTPGQRHFLSTGTQLVVTITYRTGVGAYNFLTSYVLGSIVYLLEVIAGIILDLWRSNRSYSRWAFRSIYSIVMVLSTYALTIIKAVGRTGYAAVVVGFDTLR